MKMIKPRDFVRVIKVEASFNVQGSAQMQRNVILEGINVQHIREAECLKQHNESFKKSLIHQSFGCCDYLITCMKTEHLCRFSVPLN